MKSYAKTMFGCLLIVLVSISIAYVTFQDKVRIRIDEDKTTLYIMSESGRWTVGGRESGKMLDNGSTLQRDVANIRIETLEIDNSLFIKRYTPYKRGPMVIDIYQFNSRTENKKQVPISHIIEIYNASGLVYEYKTYDLEIICGNQINVKSPLVAGKNVTVEWDNLDYANRVYNSGEFKLWFNVQSDEEVFSVRLFDPPVNFKNKCVYEMKNSIYYDAVATNETFTECTSQKCYSTVNKTWQECTVCNSSMREVIRKIKKIRKENVCKEVIGLELEFNKTQRNISFKGYGCYVNEDRLICIDNNDGYSDASRDSRTLMDCDSGETCTIYNLTDGSVLEEYGKRIDIR